MEKITNTQDDIKAETWIPQDTDTDYHLWVMLNQARDSLLKARANELSQYGISAVEAQAIFHLAKTGGESTPAEISRRMFREHNTVTALLDRMKKKGLVTKTKDRNKKNSWKIAITEKGKSAYLQTVKRETIHKVFSNLPTEERETLMGILKKIRDASLQQLITVPAIPVPSHRFQSCLNLFTR